MHTFILACTDITHEYMQACRHACTHPFIRAYVAGICAEGHSEIESEIYVSTIITYVHIYTYMVCIYIYFFFLARTVKLSVYCCVSMMLLAAVL